MNKLLCIAAAALLPLGVLAQSALDGTWKTDLKSITGADKPSRYVVKDGNYTCEHCVPKFTVKADGTDQPVKGNPAADTLAVKVVDDKVVELTSKKAGKVTWKGKWTVSADGKTMTREFNSNEANGTTSSSTAVMSRVGAPMKGAHAVTGGWKFSKAEKGSDETVTFKSANGVISALASDGSTYEAKPDGTKVPMKGNPMVDTVSLKATGKNRFEETAYYKGKNLGTNTLTVSPDGKTLKVDWRDSVRNTKGSFEMTKQ
jgi:hypothetical protein